MAISVSPIQPSSKTLSVMEALQLLKPHTFFIAFEHETKQVYLGKKLEPSTERGNIAVFKWDPSSKSLRFLIQDDRAIIEESSYTATTANTTFVVLDHLTSEQSMNIEECCMTFGFQNRFSSSSSAVAAVLGKAGLTCRFKTWEIAARPGFNQLYRAVTQRGIRYSDGQLVHQRVMSPVIGA